MAFTSQNVNIEKDSRAERRPDLAHICTEARSLVHVSNQVKSSGRTPEHAFDLYNGVMSTRNFTSCPQTSSKVNAGKEPPKATHPRPMADRRSGGASRVVWNLVTAALTGRVEDGTEGFFGDGKNITIASDRSSKYVQIRLGLKAEACCPSRRIVQLATPSGESTEKTQVKRTPRRRHNVAHVITTLFHPIAFLFPRFPRF